MGQEIFPSQSRIDTAKKLKVAKTFVPCPADADDEIYRNGIFYFNISKMLAYIHGNPEQFLVEDIPLERLSLHDSSSLNRDHLPLVDITKPIILAEIAPGRYNVIDGNHRLEQARCSGTWTIPAYRLHVHQHLPFLIEKESYIAYIQYWNSKID